MIEESGIKKVEQAFIILMMPIATLIVFAYAVAYIFTGRADG